MSPWFLALLGGPALLVPVAWYALSRHRIRGARWYGFLLITIAFWSLAYAWEIAGRDLETKLLALRIKYLAVAALPPIWIGFILEFVGSAPTRVRARVVPLWIVFVVVTAVVWTNSWHKLFWGQMVVQHVGEFLMLHGRGPGFWINIGYTYIVLAAGLVLLLRHALHSPYLYRRRAAILVVGTIVPWVGNAVFILQPGEHILDPTPFLFTCTALVAALAVFRYELFEPAPTLRDARIEAVGDGVIILDGRGRIADVNASAETILGRRRGEAAGTQIETMLPNWPAGPLPTGEMDLTLVTSGSARVFDVRCSQVQSLAGERTGAVVILRDVTERRAAEAALRESEQRYRAVIEQAFDGVWLADWTGKILDANPQAAALLGCSSAELVGRQTTEFAWSGETTLGRGTLKDGTNGSGPTSGAGSGDETALRRGEAVAWERELVTCSGRRLLVAGRSKQIADDLIVSTFRDITDERAQTELREQLLTEAQAASRLKDEFLATVSHELRTPLNAVMGWTNLLVRRQVSDPPVAHALAVIERNALAQSRLIEDLLDLSGLAGGRIRLVVRRASVPTLIQEALDAVSLSAEAKHLATRVDVPDDLPEVMADPDRLRQVIWNLLTNAIKFTTAGGAITVRARATGDELEVAVTDTGIGMAADFVPHMFDAFRQADSSNTRSSRGLGLGLTIVRRIAEAHGGRIEGESAGLGQGSTFRLILPLTRPPSSEDATNHADLSTS